MVTYKTLVACVIPFVLCDTEFADVASFASKMIAYIYMISLRWELVDACADEFCEQKALCASKIIAPQMVVRPNDFAHARFDRIFW